MATRAVVRAPNHLGELVLALPALEYASDRARREGRNPPLVQVVAGLVPILEMSGLPVEPLPLVRRRAPVSAARRIREAGCRDGVLLTPSLSSAIIFRLAGLASRRGTARGRRWLLTDAVDRAPLLRGHRVHEYLAMVGCEGSSGEPPAPVLRNLDGARQAWSRLRGELGLGEDVATGGRRTVAMVPGGNAESRRWPATRFGELARRLARLGHHVLLLGGPAERGLTAAVASDGGEGCVDLGGRTGLSELAGALLESDALVTNDTGPMHLAAALDRPIVALEGAADVRQTRPLGRRVCLVGRFELPCVPCVKNRCPRRGPGYELAHGRLECMRLITVDEVMQATMATLSEDG